MMAGIQKATPDCSFGAHLSHFWRSDSSLALYLKISEEGKIVAWGITT